MFIFNIKIDLSSLRGVYWQIIYIIYLIFLPLFWNGYITGKWFNNIKLKSYKGNKLTLIQMIKRELIGFYLLGILSLGISFLISSIMIVFREDKRAIHDFIGNTYVTEQL